MLADSNWRASGGMLMGKDAVEQMIDELRQYKQGGGKIPPDMIDRIVGLAKSMASTVST
jgi:hypothetical protein